MHMNVNCSGVRVDSSFDRLPEVLSVSETATLLRVGRNTAYDAIRRNEIPSIRLGARLLVPKHALGQLLGLSVGTGGFTCQ